MSGYTPGPWRYGADGDDTAISNVALDDANAIRALIAKTKEAAIKAATEGKTGEPEHV